MRRRNCSSIARLLRVLHTQTGHRCDGQFPSPALLVFNLMVFFELTDIERVLDQTHDPSGLGLRLQNYNYRTRRVGRLKMSSTAKDVEEAERCRDFGLRRGP